MQQHIQVAERAFGGPLPKGVEVHHFDENRRNNRNDNLVICQDKSYHQLLHRRARAYRACGNADWIRCYVCKTWGPMDAMIVIEHRDQTHFRRSFHRDCERKRKQVSSMSADQVGLERERLRAKAASDRMLRKDEINRRRRELWAQKKNAGTR